MAQTIVDPSLQNVQPSNSGGTQAFGNVNQPNSQTNQGVTFNQTSSGQGQGQQSNTSSGRNKPQGTGFTNINNLLTANQGNKLGQTIQSGITNTAQNVNQNLQNAQGSFNQDVQNNTFGSNDQSNVNNIINSASNLNSGQTIDPTQLAQFQNYTSGNYSGPTALQNAGLLQGQAQTVQQLGQDVNSAGGQQSLLQRFVGGPQYTQGQQTLDQLLLGQQQGALNQAQSATAGLSNKALSTINNASQVAAQAQEANKAFGQQAATAATNAENPINTAINTTVTNDLKQQNQLQNQYNQLQTILAETPDQYNSSVSTPGATAPSAGQEQVNQLNAIFANLQSAGVDPNTVQQLAGPTLQANINDVPGYIQALKNNISLNNASPLAVSAGSNYGTSNYQVNPADISSLQNQQAVMTQAQAAQLNALSQLSGGTGNINPTGVGTYNPAGINVNVNGLTPAQSATKASAPASSGGYNGLGSNIASDILNPVGTLAAGGVGAAGSLLNSATGGVLAQPISIASNIASSITNPVSQVFGGGGGGKIICNELYRQGYIDEKTIRLDEEFGKKYRRLNPDAYRGYLFIATPIVALMKRNAFVTKMISYISLPWAQYMANTMDNSIEGSNLGKVIHNLGMFIFPKIYKINKFFKRVKNEYKMV